MNIFYRTAFFFVGIMIISLGVVLTIKADLGAGAWDALNIALSHHVGLTVGSWVVLIGLLLIVINAWLMKEKPVLFAIITIFIIGGLIDFWMLTIFSSWFPQGFVWKMIVLLIGLAVIGFGAAIYLQAKFPLNPVDQFMMALKERFNVSLMTAKTMGELLALSFALLLKGPIGIGTFIITFAIGPFIQLFYPFFEKVMTKCLKNS